MLLLHLTIKFIFLLVKQLSVFFLLFLNFIKSFNLSSHEIIKLLRIVLCFFSILLLIGICGIIREKLIDILKTHFHLFSNAVVSLIVLIIKHRSSLSGFLNVTRGSKSLSVGTRIFVGSLF